MYFRYCIAKLINNITYISPKNSKFSPTISHKSIFLFPLNKKKERKNRSICFKFCQAKNIKIMKFTPEKHDSFFPLKIFVILMKKHFSVLFFFLFCCMCIWIEFMVWHKRREIALFVLMPKQKILWFVLAKCYLASFLWQLRGFSYILMLTKLIAYYTHCIASIINLSIHRNQCIYTRPQ